MPTTDPSQEMKGGAALLATAEQLDIAGEDVAEALEEVLATFEATSTALDQVIYILQTCPDHPPDELAKEIVGIRNRLSSTIVSLQFEDRLSQRLRLAAQNLRGSALASDAKQTKMTEQSPLLASTVHSLYERGQICRILNAAGFDTRESDAQAEQNIPAKDDIELF